MRMKTIKDWTETIKDLTETIKDLTKTIKDATNFFIVPAFFPRPETFVWKWVLGGSAGSEPCSIGESANETCMESTSILSK